MNFVHNQCSVQYRIIVVILSLAPFAKKVYDIFKHNSADWDSFGRELKVSINYQRELSMIPTGVSADYKLYLVIHKWVESKCSPVNWSTVRQVLTTLDMKLLLSLVPAED